MSTDNKSQPGEVTDDQLAPVWQAIEQAEKILSERDEPDTYGEQCVELLKSLSISGLYPCTSSLFYLNEILDGNTESGMEKGDSVDWVEEIEAALVSCNMTDIADNYEKVRELSVMNESNATDTVKAAIKNADPKELALWLDESPSLVAATRFPDLSDWQQFRLIVLDSFVLTIIADNWADQLKDWHRFFILYLEPALIHEG